MNTHVGDLEVTQASIASDIHAILGPDGATGALWLAASLVEFAAYERAPVSRPSDTAALILIAAALSQTAEGDRDALARVKSLARAILEMATERETG